MAEGLALSPRPPTSPALQRLLVVSHPSVVAVNQAMYSLLPELGWDPIVVLPERWRHDYASEGFRPETWPGMEGRIIPRPVLFAGRPQRHLYRVRLAPLIAELEPRVAFVEEETFSLPAAQWAAALSRANIPFGVQAAENLDRPLPLIARKARAFTLRRVSFVAARSPAAAELARGWGARGHIGVVPHAVPAWPRVSPSPARPFTVGYAGRLVPEKGIRDLVEATRRMSGPVRLLLVGNGPLRPELERTQLPNGSIEILTDVPHAEMPRAYAEMDVLVLPSRTTPTWTEQFGRVLVEALWCGVPVVGSNSGEIPWVVSVTRGGRIYPEGDIPALTTILERLRDRPRERAALADEGRRAVEGAFSLEASASALDDLLRSSLTRSPGARASRRPRVALVAHGIHDHGGMERAFAELIRRAHPEFEFVVFASELAPELRPLVTWRRIVVPRRPIPLKFAAFYLLAGARLALVRPDLVHTLGALVPNRVDLASVHFCHAGFREATAGSGSLGRPPLRRLNSALARRLGLAAERRTYREGRARHLAAVSAGVLDEVARHYPEVERSLTANGVDQSRFHPSATVRAELRSELGVDRQTAVALFVGGDWDHKGLAPAIAGLGEACREGADLELWVVGRGDRRRFGALARTHGVEQRVRFLDFRPDVERVFQAADMFVLPTLYETFSLAAHEAAATGLPVVATFVNGVADLVGRNEAGILVERDARAIGEALARLAGNEDLRQRLGAEARRRAQRHTWEHSVAAVVAAYARLRAVPSAEAAEAA